jgi:hypothetical protein
VFKAASVVVDLPHPGSPLKTRPPSGVAIASRPGHRAGKPLGSPRRPSVGSAYDECFVLPTDVHLQTRHLPDFGVMETMRPDPYPATQLLKIRPAFVGKHSVPFQRDFDVRLSIRLVKQWLKIGTGKGEKIIPPGDHPQPRLVK